MATTEYPVNHPSAKKLWAESLFREALKRTWASKFIGKSQNSAIQLLTDTQKSAGDRITYTLKMQLSGSGVSGDNTLEGNEEALATYTDNILIDQLRHAVKSAGKMSEQRVTWSMREEMRDSLADWWSDRINRLVPTFA